VKNILLLLRKDLRLNRLWLTGWLLVVAADIIYVSVTGESVAGSDDRRRQLWWLGGCVLATLHLLPLPLLVCRIVQADSPARVTAFWLTRPLSRLQVLTAKCVFVGTFLILPCLVAHGLAFVANGLPLAEAWPWLVYTLLWWCCALASVAAVASLTRDVSGAAVLSAVLLTVVTASWYLSNLLSPRGASSYHTRSADLGWQGVSSAIAAVASGAVVAVVVFACQYLTRRAGWSMAVLALGGILVGPTLVLWRWDFVGAWQIATSTLDWSRVTLMARRNSVEVWRHVWDATRPGHTSICWNLSGSVVASGLPNGWTWEIRDLEPVLRSPGGRTWSATSMGNVRPIELLCPKPDSAHSPEMAVPQGAACTWLADAAGAVNFLEPRRPSISRWTLVVDASDRELAQDASQPLRLKATARLLAQHHSVLARVPVRPEARSEGINPRLRILSVNPPISGYDPRKFAVVDVQVRRVACSMFGQYKGGTYVLLNPKRREAVLGYTQDNRQFSPSLTFSGLVIERVRIQIRRNGSADTGCSERAAECLRVTDDWLREAQLVELGADEWAETTRELAIDNDNLVWDGPTDLMCGSRVSAGSTAHAATARLKTGAELCAEGQNPDPECRPNRWRGDGQESAPQDMYRSRCAGRDAPACFSLAELRALSWWLSVRDYAARRDPAQESVYQDALQRSHKACEAGKAEVCLLLASMYDHGQNLRKDPVRAVELYQRAVRLSRETCDKGDPGDCANLGRLYALGNGVLQDAAKAAQLYQRACAESDLVGCLWLAHMYRDGAGGMTVDPVKAAKLYQKACDGGVPQACANLKE
jgi:hypothetical protein